MGNHLNYGVQDPYDRVEKKDLKVCSFCKESYDILDSQTLIVTFLNGYMCYNCVSEITARQAVDFMSPAVVDDAFINELDNAKAKLNKQIKF